MKSFFKFLSRNLLYTLIDLFGLSVSIGFIILLAGYAHTEYNVGARQKDAKNIYVLGSGSFIGMTLGTMPVLGKNIPEISSYTRVEGGWSSDFNVDDNYYQAKGILVDTNFFRFFDYSLIGIDNDKALLTKDRVVLSESFARSVFGNENPIGKNIKVISGPLPDLTVVGIIKDFGAFDLFEKIDYICSIENSINVQMDQFGMVSSFITLSEGASPEDVNSKLLDEYVKYWSFYKADGGSNTMLWGSSLTRFDKIYFSDLDKYPPFRSGNSRQVNILLVVGLVLLISAIFNYVNLTVAQTGKRAKEMATRRLLGSSRRQIVWRYLSESFLFTTGSFVIGCILAYTFLPHFNSILQANISLAPELSSILVCITFLLLISFISGIMPALLVSKYKPVDVVKGNFSFNSRMRTGSVFIVLQNLISVILLAVAFTAMLQIHHLSTLPVGYNTKNLIQINAWPLRGNSKQLILRERLKSLPIVKDVAMCGQLPSLCGFNGAPIDVDNMVYLAMPTIDTTAFRMFGFNVLEYFSDPTDGKIWLTRKAQGLFNASKDNPKICYDSRYEVCGVIEDYHVRDAIFKPMDNAYNAVKIIDDSYKYISMFLVEVTGDKDIALKAVKDACNQTSLEIFGIEKPIDVCYIDDFLSDQIKGKKNTMYLVLLFMIVSVLISALGLLAMSMYFTQRQSRQVAVRKVFGASVDDEVSRLSRRFLTMSAIATIISIPISVYLINLYLRDFANRIDFPVIALVLAAVFSLLVAFISVFGTSYSASLKNPVETLKKE